MARVPISIDDFHWIRERRRAGGFYDEVELVDEGRDSTYADCKDDRDAVLVKTARRLDL